MLIEPKDNVLQQASLTLIVGGWLCPHFFQNAIYWFFTMILGDQEGVQSTPALKLHPEAPHYYG